MFSTLRTRFGIPGVISVMALVFAMFGGAYAANNSASGGGKATASAKAKKGPRGPKGAKGDTGPAGPQGPVGSAGAAGAKGDKGDTGAAGSNGSNGTQGEQGEPGEPGEPGPTGPEGVCSTENCVLPSGATLKGTWTLPPTTTTAANENLYVAISSSIPIGTPVFAQSVAPGAADPNQIFGCTGTAEHPTIEPTSSVPAGAALICVYEQEANNIKPISVSGTKLSESGGGAAVIFRSEGASGEKGPARGWGSWIVKAP
jgi:hypothetical protein